MVHLSRAIKVDDKSIIGEIQTHFFLGVLCVLVTNFVIGVVGVLVVLCSCFKRVGFAAGCGLRALLIFLPGRKKDIRPISGLSLPNRPFLPRQSLARLTLA
jgi:hypothetical protein